MEFSQLLNNLKLNFFAARSAEVIMTVLPDNTDFDAYKVGEQIDFTCKVQVSPGFYILF